jgi:hypothetical protein
MGREKVTVKIDTSINEQVVSVILQAPDRAPITYTARKEGARWKIDSPPAGVSAIGYFKSPDAVARHLMAVAMAVSRGELPG